MENNTAKLTGTITANVTCLYVMRIGQNEYCKLHMLFVFADDTNRYVWATTTDRGASNKFEPNHEYKIKCRIDKELCPNEYKVQRVKAI